MSIGDQNREGYCPFQVLGRDTTLVSRQEDLRTRVPGKACRDRLPCVLCRDMVGYMVVGSMLRHDLLCHNSSTSVGGWSLSQPNFLCRNRVWLFSVTT